MSQKRLDNAGSLHIRCSATIKAMPPHRIHIYSQNTRHIVSGSFFGCTLFISREAQFHLLYNDVLLVADAMFIQ